MKRPNQLPPHLATRVVEPKALIRASEPPPRPPQPPTGTTTPPEASKPATVAKTMQFRYAAATHSFYAETGRFRIVVEGPEHEQPAVLAALQHLRETK